DADPDRAGHFLQDDVRERHVLEPRPRTPVELERTAEYLMQHTVRHRDVLGDATAEAEDGPPRAEVGARHRHELAAPEQRAGVVLRLDGAVADRDMLAADEMEAVVVAVDAVEDVQAVHDDVLALNDADAVVGAVPEPQRADAEMLAAMEQQMIRPLEA